MQAKIMHVHFWGDVRRREGSVEKVIGSFACMDEQDLAVSVACPGEGGSERIGTANYHFFTEDHLKNRVANKLLGLKLFTYSSLVSLIEQERPDLLHIHNRHALVGPLLARLSYRPCVLCHYHRKFANFVVPAAADGLIAVSGAVRDALLAAVRPTMPIEIVYNPLPEGLEGEARPRGSRPRLLYGGGRQDHKGFPELEAALSEGLGENFDVLLCGPGFADYRPPFPARVLGMLPPGEFLAELRATDVITMPSHHEGFSILALEALGLGRLMVATQGGGLGEVLDASNALIHTVGDAEGLGGALRRALALLQPEQSVELARFQAAARATAAHFSMAAINVRLASVYRHFLGLTQ